MSKSYFIFEDGLHEYTIVDTLLENDVRRLQLKYSDAEHWDAKVRGTLIVNMDIHDLDAIITPPINNIDASQLHAIRLLLNFERETNTSKKVVSEVIDTTNKISL